MNWVGGDFFFESKAVSQLEGVNLMSDRVLAAKYGACVFNLEWFLFIYDERSI